MDDYLGISPKTSNEFKVTETGELERAVRPFSRNIRIDEFENLRDNMTDTESALSTLAEVSGRANQKKPLRKGKSLARAQPDSFILSRPPDNAVG